MADNITLTGGQVAATVQGTHSGDTAHIPLVVLAKATGSEGSWTFTLNPIVDVNVASSDLDPTLATTDSIAAKLATDRIMDGTTALVPKFAAIAASSSGNNTIVAAVAGKKIRVLQYLLTGSGAVNAKFQSGAGGTDLTGLHYIAAAGGGAAAAFSPVGWFETASGVLLNLNLSGAVAVGGSVAYVEV